MGRSWCGWRFPDHINYFSPATLGHLVVDIGFSYKWVNWLSVFDDNIIAELSAPAGPGNGAAHNVAD